MVTVDANIGETLTIEAYNRIAILSCGNRCVIEYINQVRVPLDELIPSPWISIQTERAKPAPLEDALDAPAVEEVPKSFTDMLCTVWISSTVAMLERRKFTFFNASSSLNKSVAVVISEMVSFMSCLLIVDGD